MLVTLVLRLLPDRLAKGEFVGEVEHVGDGEQSLVRDLPGLLEFAQRAAAAEAGDGSKSEDPAAR